MALASCNALNCVYLLSRRHGCQVSVARITRDDDHHAVSYIINDFWPASAKSNSIRSFQWWLNSIIISRGGLHRDKCVRCDWFLATWDECPRRFPLQTQPNRSKIEREPRVGFMRQKRMPCGFVGDRLQWNHSKAIRVRFRLLCHACLSSWQWLDAW